MVRCKICLKELSNNSSKYRHIREVHGPKKLCPFCFDFYGRLSHHYNSCKKYLSYQLHKLKVIGQEIYFINEPKKRNDSKRANKKLTSKSRLKGAVNIGKTNYYYYPDKLIGRGSFCNVYYGFDNLIKRECAIKIFNDAEGNYEKFLFEELLLKDLKKLTLFPKLYYSSREDLILVESLLGPSIRKLFSFCGNIFPICTICYIGIEVISRLQEYHSYGYLHRDLKPSNFVWGNFSKSTNDFNDNILLIDYDLSGRYKTKDNKHIQYEIEVDTFGCKLYKSINSSDNVSVSRRDDLESLLYCLIYLFNGGDLPWNKTTIDQIYAKVNRKELKNKKNNKEENVSLISKSSIEYELKKGISPKVLCKDLPTEFEVILYYIRNLKFDEEPNYELIKDLFKRVINNNEDNNEEGPYKYIWEKKLIDVFEGSKSCKNENFDKIKNELFQGYDINIKKFITPIKKNEKIKIKSLLK